MPTSARLLLAIAPILLLAGCATSAKPKPVTASAVDLPKFMGAWYVLASIPLWPEKNSYNGVESYALDEKGRIQTTYTFRKGGFDGPLKTFRPVARVHNRETNAEWKMQFLWPFSADFLIHYVSADYQETIIGEPGLDYVWLMSRSSAAGPGQLEALIARAGELGYDTNKVRRVPQHWPEYQQVKP